MNIELVKQEQNFLQAIYNKNAKIIELYEENQLLKHTLDNIGEKNG